MLVPGSDFKSDGSRGDATPAGSIPVRFRLRLVQRATCALAALALTAACAGAPAPVSVLAPDTDSDLAPSWTAGDCRSYWQAEPRPALCGVGSADGAGNPALVRSTARARAHAALGASLEAAVGAMLLEYAATEPGRQDLDLGADGKRHIARAARAVAEAALAQASVSETWRSPSGVEYALAGLDAETFTSVVRDMHELRPSLRRALTERADATFAAP